MAKKANVSIQKVRRTPLNDLNSDIQWFCESLCLFSKRDKDKSLYRIFLELLKHAKANQTLTSVELAFALNLSRGTVVFHLNKLISAGIVVRKEGKYGLRSQNLSAIVEDMKRDTFALYEEIEKVAKKIDRSL